MSIKINMIGLQLAEKAGILRKIADLLDANNPKQKINLQLEITFMETST